MQRSLDAILYENAEISIPEAQIDAVEFAQQFGYDDHAGGDLAKRSAIYTEWRRRWVDAGMLWWSQGRKPPPSWNPIARLAKVQGG